MQVRVDVVLDKTKCYIDTWQIHLIGRMHRRGLEHARGDWFQVARD